MRKYDEPAVMQHSERRRARCKQYCRKAFRKNRDTCDVINTKGMICLRFPSRYYPRGGLACRRTLDRFDFSHSVEFSRYRDVEVWVRLCFGDLSIIILREPSNPTNSLPGPKAKTECRC